MRNWDYFKRWLKAKALGYFWLPCERCGHMFAGHEEFGDREYEIRTGEYSRHLVCKRHKAPRYAYSKEDPTARTTTLYDTHGMILDTIRWDADWKRKLYIDERF